MRVKLLQTNRMLRLLLCLAVAVAWEGAALAQTGNLDKIDPELQELMHLSRDANETFRIIIEMTEQYDSANLERSTALMTRPQRRDYVVNELKRFSERSQTEVVNFLSEQSTRDQVNVLHRFWIFNGVCCEATAGCIGELSIRHDIRYVSLDKVMQIVEPIEQESSNREDNPPEGIQWHVSKVRANEVWNYPNTPNGYTGAGVVVAIIDTGVNYEHVDISGNMWNNSTDPNYNPDFPNHGWDIGDDDDDPKHNENDTEGHGSHVAGIVASKGVTYKAGVAPNAKIMAIKVQDRNGNIYDDYLISGCEFALDQDADIINMSLGAPGTGGKWYQRREFINVMIAGVVATVSAGNHADEYLNYPVPNNIAAPGNCPPPWHNPDQILQGGASAVICVGNTTNEDIREVTSSIGPVTWSQGEYIGDYNDYPYNLNPPYSLKGLIRPDVSAPGTAIWSLSHDNSSTYCIKSGTSMAAPCVAGVIALMLEANPNLTPEQIDRILETTAEPCENQTSKNNYYGAGRVDAYRAVSAAIPRLITTQAMPPIGGTVEGGGSFLMDDQCTVTATPNNGYVFAGWYDGVILISMSPSYSFTVNGDRSLTAMFAPTNCTITATASPTEGGIVSGGGTFQGGATCTLTATPASGYTFSSWSENGTIVSTNATYSFTVTGDRNLVANFVVSGGSSHEYVDLGLPSGTLWATCNIGASSPEDYGHYFAWGETTPKSTYSWENYQYCHGSSNSLAKYCYTSVYGYNGYTDNLTTLLPEDDVATANWGDGWRMPTLEEVMELLDNTIYAWTTRNGVDGILYSASNGETLFMPAAGYYPDDELFQTGGYCCYWSSSTREDDASGLNFLSRNGEYSILSDLRKWGQSVRAVRASQSSATTYIVTARPNIVEGGTLTNEQQEQICTVTATVNEGYTFNGWTENGTMVSTNASYSFTVTGDRNLVANYTLNPLYTISVSASPSDGGMVSGGGSYRGGTTCTLAATVNAGYTFNGWTENGAVVSTNANYSFTVTGDRNLVANYTPNPLYTISTSVSPSNGGTVSGGGSYRGGTTCTLTATANTSYDFKNWTVNGTVVSTNTTYSFTVTGNKTLVANFVFVGAGTYVDLGLPSGTLWANCNIGANAPEEYGNYFAWGETQQKNAYDWSTYQYCNGSNNTLVKYCNNSQYGYNGYTDNLTTLLPGDDAATTNWGENWRMATEEEWNELLNNTTNTGTMRNGIEGRLFTATNGATLFLPAAGWYSSSGLHSGSSGYYWSSSLDRTSYAKVLYANSGQISTDSRYFGQSVRAVRASQSSATTYIVTARPNIVEGGILTNTQQGQRCTVTATSNIGYIFNNWTENGTVVSTNASYTFTVTGNRTLVANFRECSVLSNLAVTNNSITSQSATVTWTGSDESYIVQVMQNQTTVLNEGFENNGTTLPVGWTSVAGTGNGQWVVKTGDNNNSIGAHAGTYNVSCPHTSLNNTTYLISPAIDLSGATSATLKFWMINRSWLGDIDECHVYYRVNGGDWNGPLFSTTEKHSTWTEITVPLQGLAANYQIGFMSVDHFGFDLSLDDITVESVSWITVNSSTTSPYTFSCLIPNTTYSVRVLSVCENTSNVLSFTTLDTHTLTTSVNPSASGSIACYPSAVNGIYDHGTQVQLTAMANTGYTFINWTENGAVVSTNASFTITITGNRTLVANFVDNTVNYTISASASLSNGGTVSGGGTYQGASTCTLIASANDGYCFTNWTENGTVVSTEASYSFMVAGNRTLVANFVEGNLIGDGGDATNSYLPSYSYYKYSLSQQIYTADEIGSAGLITSIAFYNGGAEKTRTYDIYLVHTNKTVFDSDTDWIIVTEADKVFSDSMVMVANDWTVFVLDTPFAYDGTSNLAIIVDDNSGNYTFSPHMTCRVFDANGNQTIRVYSDNTNYDPMSPPTSYESSEHAALQSVKNQIVFEIMLTYHFVTSGNWGNASNWSSGVLPGANNAVFIDANCILNRDAEVASLAITSGKTLTLRSDKTLTVTGTLSSTATTDLVIQDRAQLINSSPEVAATLRKSIATQGNASNNGWYTIASPMKGMVIANSGFVTYDYDLYRFNETNLTNEEWENYKANHADFTSFEKGRGYLYANSRSFMPNFTGILNASAITCSLTCTTRPNDPLSGFNLIGNPFPHKIYKGAGGAIDDVNLASGYYTLTNEGTWQAHTFEDAILPGQGILVKATAPVELTIAKSTEEAFAESGEAKRGAGRLNISVAGDGGDDRAFVYFGQGNDLDKVEDFTQATPKLAIRTEKGNFAIAHIDKESDAVELVFTTPTDGSFILTVDVAWADFKYLHLIDLATGDDIELLSVLRPFDGPQGPQAQEPMSYTFTITEQGGERHFKLLYKLSGEKENQ